MLILNHQEVRYCQVIRPILGKFNKLPGLAYHDRLFYKLESHPKTEYKATVKRARDFFDKAEQRLIILVIEEPTCISIWREDNKLISAQKFESYLSTKEEIYLQKNWKEIVEQNCQETVTKRIKTVMVTDLSKVFGAS